MMALIRTGTTTIDRLSAVTFTIRAAAELSERFQTALEAAARAASGAGARPPRGRALAPRRRVRRHDPRLLRAPAAGAARRGRSGSGVRRDGRARERRGAPRGAGSRYTERLFTGESPILPRLAALGVRLEDLRQTYETLSDNEDVEPAIGPEEPPPDFTAERRSGRGVPRARRRGPAGRDAAREAGTNSRRRCGAPLRIVALGDAPDATAFARILDALVRARNKGEGCRPAADRIRNALPRRRSSRACARWREYLHPILMRRRRAGRRRVRRVAAAQRAPELPGPPAARARPAARSSAGPARLPGALPAHPRRRVPGHRPDPGGDPLLPDG